MKTGIATHIAEIASPVFGFTITSHTQLDQHLKIFQLENLLGSDLVHLFGLSVHQNG